MPQAALGAIMVGGSWAASAGTFGALMASTSMLGIAANFGASLLLSGISQALMGKQSVGADMGGIQVTRPETTKAREVVYGQIRKGGTVVYLATSGEDGFEDRGKAGKGRGIRLLHMVIVLAAHSVDHIGAVYFNGEMALDINGRQIGKYVNKVAAIYQRGHEETPPVTQLRFWLPEWTMAHELRGCAVLALRLTFDTETFPNGVPNVTVDMRGKNSIWDPRIEEGGYSTNAALCLADYMSNTQYGVGARYGSAQGIRTDDLIEAANICDEWVTSHSTTERRYTCNGVVDLSATPQAIIEGLLSAMAGKAIRKGGAWSIHAGAYRAPSLHITDDDAAGSLQLVTRLSRSENFNGVRGTFISPENDWQPDDFPAYRSAVYLAEDSGVESWRDIALRFTTSPYTAQRIAKIELETARRQMSVTFPASIRALQVGCGDTVTLTRDRWGFAEKPFAVTSVTLQPAADGIGLMPVLALSEVSPLAWTWGATEGQIYAAAPRSTLLPE